MHTDPKAELFYNILNEIYIQIHEKGFMSGNQIACEIAVFGKICKDNGATTEEALKFVFEHITDNKNFHSVEYANASTEDFRRKDLYYYCPKN